MYFKKLLHSIVLTASISTAITTGVVAQGLQKGPRDAEFEAWLQDFKTDAIKEGISTETLDEVLPKIMPLKRVIKRDRNQPEVKQTYGTYLTKRVSPWRKRKGAEMMAKHKDALNAAGAKYGVQPRFIAAIWGLETNYGTVGLSYSVFDAVATLAHDKRRGKRFRRELIAAFKILDQGYLSYDEMKSSWAGAMGQPQFMPENYLKYAVDQDGDGHANIWNSEEDIFASIANYLKSYDWQDDQTWGRAVTLPEGGEISLAAKQATGIKPDRWCAAYKSMGAWHGLNEWQSKGVRRDDGSDLPTRNLPAALIIGDEGDNQGYVVYRNFCSIMRYNPSFKYALAVSLLASEIDK